MLTGPEAGITRDAVASDLEFDGKPVKLWDTAGLRRKARVKDRLEKLSVADALRAVRFAEVVVVVVDATMPFEKQDLQIADLAAGEGRGLVIAANKWDEVADKQSRLHGIKREVEEKLSQVKGVPLVAISALRGQGLDRLMRAVLGGLRRLEQAHRHRSPEPMAGGGRGAPSSAGAGRQAHQDQVHDPGQRSPAYLRRLLLQRQRSAGLLCSLSGQRLAREIRVCGRAHTHFPASGRKPVCRAPLSGTRLG